VMAQRLVRRLCPHCSEPVDVTELEEAHRHLVLNAQQAYDKNTSATAPQLRRAVGCEACMHTGYLGRVAIYELFNMDDDLRHQIISVASEAEITQSLRAKGVRALAGDGLLKVWRGITTVAEVLAVS
jgi:general secretion pathway protein E